MFYYVLVILCYIYVMFLLCFACRAEQLAQLANQANQNISNRIARGGSFLKKKVARRSKSTSGRDARDDTYDGIYSK